MSRTVAVRKEDGRTYQVRWTGSSLREIEQLFMNRIHPGDLVMIQRASIFRLASVAPVLWKTVYFEKTEVTVHKRQMSMVSAMF